MKSFFVSLALVAGLAGPATASTFLDFTSKGIGAANPTGNVFGIGFEISANPGGTLVNARHKNNVGCDVGYGFTCNDARPKKTRRYDVGFGVRGGQNNNEIDGVDLNAQNGTGNDHGEYVQVAFDSIVRILGFAGMLTYNDSQGSGSGSEQTVLQYSLDNVTWSSVTGITQNTDADGEFGSCGNDCFGTVGLSYLRGLSLDARYVRFTAGGSSPFDNRNANVTAAGLEVAPVPVPAALPLLLAGLGALGWTARRGNRKAA